MAVDSPKKNFKNPTSCASAFGRFFYAVDSMVYFTQIVETDSDVGRCYQQNDPTSSEFPDLLDTDGGVIELEDTQRIKAMQSYSSGVLIFAGNGVWYIYNPDGGFKATSFNVEKITDRGIDSAKSIVVADNNIYYFSNNAIMQIAVNQFNTADATDITETSIRSYYLSTLAGEGAQGVYNSGTKQCEWWLPKTQGAGLVLDTTVGAFYPQKQSSASYKLRMPFTIANALYYPSSLQTDTNVTYSFSSRVNRVFKDFGTDQEAYLVTGYETLGKFSNKKAVSQAKVFFRKTETTITGYEADSYVFDYPSACLFQARWDFDKSAAYGKYTGILNGEGRGKAMQLYKPMQRGFIPDDYPYTFDTGESLISKKFNIRGNGDAVQFVFQAEPEKDMQLLGYSVGYTMRGRM
tara:strand:+ start:11605 stop:12822 length:1218 start_codon:yes stop_codon:yes gene_type:complete